MNKYLKTCIVLTLANSVFYQSIFLQLSKEKYDEAKHIIIRGLDNFNILLRLTEDLSSQEYYENLYQIMNVFADITFSMRYMIFYKARQLVEKVSLVNDVGMTEKQKEFFIKSLEDFLWREEWKENQLFDFIFQTKCFVCAYYFDLVEKIPEKDKELLQSYGYMLRQYFKAYSSFRFKDLLDNFNCYFLYLILLKFNKEELCLLCKIDEAIGTEFYEKFVQDKKINWDSIVENIKNKKEGQRNRRDSGYMSSDAGSLELNISLMKSKYDSKSKCLDFISKIYHTDIKFVLRKSLDHYTFETKKRRTSSNSSYCGSEGPNFSSYLFS